MVKKRQLIITIIAIIIFLSKNTHADIIIISSSKIYYKQAIELFLKELEAKKIETSKVEIVYDNFKNFYIKDDSFIISLGGDLTKKILRKNYKKIFFFMTADADLYDLSLKINNSKSDKKISGIFYLPEIKKRLEVLKEIFNSNIIISILHSKSSLFYAKKIKSEADKLGIKVILIEANKENFTTKIEEAFSKGNIFWMIPDESIYNQTTIKLILISAVKKGIPVISFSPVFIDIGAFMSYQIDINDYIKEAAETFLKCYQKDICEIKFTKNFKIIINKNLAKFWNIKIKTKSDFFILK
ncbi:ABC transporter substrate binding protein [Thermodesulfatator indicus]